MSEEKRNRLIAAATVNLILLIAILAVVCIYQIVQLVTLNNMKGEIQDQITYYQTETNKNQQTLDYYKSEEGLVDLAYKYGFYSGRK